MRTLNVPPTQLYASENVVLVEWHDDEHRQAAFRIIDDKAVFAGLNVVRGETHEIEGATLDDVPVGVRSIVDSLDYELHYAADNEAEDDSDDDHARHIA
jgi:hypothetical protein